MKVIDLLQRIANKEELPLIKYRDKILHWNKEKDRFENEDGMDTLYEMDFSELNDEVEILEEENELHANSVEFNINNDKRDCIITLEENDLGINKLHLDNCYFYKENGKWYIKKYDFKTINIEEDKNIEKLENEKQFYSYRKYADIKNDIDKILYILKGLNLAEEKIDNLNNKINEIIDKINKEK